MERYKVNLSELAERDIRGIIRYISSDLSAPGAAENMLGIIESALKKLSTMPEIHPLVQDEALALAGFRKVIIKNYLAFYTVDNKTKSVDVARVLYSRRDWRHIV
ncbi:MAG: type II toxin-antitoxin system RelE/ParE family toxin [Coriobacteriales bacterium]|jgi:addiction module RelE/StbE family toxin|nr:type II toxin-antitoxin system RelE/ParE family toxin [Coriobacteriales bacterium]